MCVAGGGGGTRDKGRRDRLSSGIEDGVSEARPFVRGFTEIPFILQIQHFREQRSENCTVPSENNTTSGILEEKNSPRGVWEMRLQVWLKSDLGIAICARGFTQHCTSNGEL